VEWNFAGQELGAEGVAVIAQLLVGADSLRRLNVANNIICSKGNVEGLKALIAAIKEMPNLSSLNLNTNWLKKDGAVELAKALPECKALVSLSVNNNGITGEAAQDLAKVVLEHGLLTDFGGIPMDELRENSLTELDLNGKRVGVPEALVLAGLLPAASALISCSLAGNNLTNLGRDMSGVKALAAALKDSQIVNLNLAENFICYGGEMEGLNALIAAIKEMPNLSTLNLANNSICCEGNMEGLNALIEAFKQMPQLVSLNLANNILCYFGNMEGLNALIAAFKQMPQLASLNVQDNNLDESSKQLLREAAPNVTITC